MGKKLRKVQKGSKWKKNSPGGPQRENVVQQYGVKTLNGNRNALK